MKSPAFQFYVDDFLAGTMHMTAEEIGGYMLLLCRQWDKGHLPNDDMALLKISRIREKNSLETVKEKFVCRDGKLYNKRLETVRRQKQKFIKSRQDAGKVGAAKRWQKDSTCHSTATPEGMAKNASPSPTPSPSPSIVEKASLSLSAVFDEWNKFADNTKLPKCLILSDKRRRYLQARLRDEFFVTNWQAALLKIQASDFCKGSNKTGWRATFDWFIQPDSVAKIIEGKYANQKPAPIKPTNPNIF